MSPPWLESRGCQFDPTFWLQSYISDFANLYLDDPSMSVCVRVCVCVRRKWFLGNCWSHHCPTWHSDCLGHDNASGVIILTLTFIQGHTDLNRENNECLIISETVQAMPNNLAVKIVRLKVYITITSLMTLTFIQGYKWISNLTTF